MKIDLHHQLLTWRRELRRQGIAVAVEAIRHESDAIRASSARRFIAWRAALRGGDAEAAPFFDLQPFQRLGKAARAARFPRAKFSRAIPQSAVAMSRNEILKSLRG